MTKPRTVWPFTDLEGLILLTLVGIFVAYGLGWYTGFEDGRALLRCQ